VLNKVSAVANKLPQVVNLGSSDENSINFMEVARQMMGVEDKPLYTPEQLRAIRARAKEIMARIKERMAQLDELMDEKDELMSFAEIDPMFDESVVTPPVLAEEIERAQGES
jgi:hypothetical protein